jgi:hypothetical protein
VKIVQILPAPEGTYRVTTRFPSHYHHGDAEEAFHTPIERVDYLIAVNGVHTAELGIEDASQVRAVTLSELSDNGDVALVDAYDQDTRRAIWPESYQLVRSWDDAYGVAIGQMQWLFGLLASHDTPDGAWFAAHREVVKYREVEDGAIAILPGHWFAQPGPCSVCGQAEPSF